MRAVVQRVRRATVSVAGSQVAAIGPGLLVLVGIERGDTTAEAERLARKVADLRLFEDPPGKMQRSVLETGGELLLVPQFTLLGDCRRGRRPDFSHAASPKEAEPLFQQCAENLRTWGLKCSEGRFREHMVVSLENEGPVTLILDTRTSGTERSSA